MKKNLNKKLNLKVEKIHVLDVNDATQVYGGAKPPKTKLDGDCAPSSPNNPSTCQGATCIFLDGCPVID